MGKIRVIYTLIVSIGLLLSVNIASADPLIGPCQVFPLDNPWNADISGATVHPNSNAIITNIMANGGDNVHPDFGSDPSYGIPYITVSGTQKKVPVTFEYDDESDPGPYPFPPNAPIEGGGDKHVIVIDTDNCVLYETYNSRYVGGINQAWEADSGAIHNLNSNAIRPDGWTSADAAGLPIFPGLARCAEAETGTINHAFRFTVNRTRSAYIYPATHEASSQTGANYPPMGLRLRLKAGYDLSEFTGQSLAIAQALKKYGMILADNGSNWYISGERDQNCWDDDDLNQLKGIPGTAFEVVESPPPATVVLPAPSLSYPVNEGLSAVTQPTLVWNTITGAVEYEVQLGSSAATVETVATVSSTSLTLYTPSTPLIVGAEYFWQVRAFDDGANPTGWSPMNSFVIESPANAAPSRNYLTSTPPIVSWNRVTWATLYELEVDTTNTFAAPLTYTTIVPATTLQATIPSAGLTNGTYYWRVRAKNGTTNGNWSIVESFIINE